MAHFFDLGLPILFRVKLVMQFFKCYKNFKLHFYNLLAENKRANSVVNIMVQRTANENAACLRRICKGSDQPAEHLIWLATPC